MSYENISNFQYTMKKKKIIETSIKYHFLLWLFFLVIFSCVFFFFSELDKDISYYFYDFPNARWRLQQNLGVRFFYAYGGVPQLLALNILWFFLLWRFIQKKSFITFSKTLLIIASIFLSEFFVSVAKEFFARARPRDIVLFGGDDIFTGFLRLGEAGLSFPSSHAKSGFIMVVLFYFFLASRLKIAYFFLGFSFVWGIAISFARIAQGGHFFSDIIFSLFLAHFVVIVMAYIFKQWQPTLQSRLYKVLFIVFSILLLVIHWDLIARFYPYLLFQK